MPINFLALYPELLYIKQMIYGKSPRLITRIISQNTDGSVAEDEICSMIQLMKIKRRIKRHGSGISLCFDGEHYNIMIFKINRGDSSEKTNAGTNRAVLKKSVGAEECRRLEPDGGIKAAGFFLGS